MMNPEQIKSIPKIELHRHLSGAVTSRAMYDIAAEHGLEVEGGSVKAFTDLTSMAKGEKGFHTLLEKFKPRSRYYVDPDLAGEVTRSVIRDAAEDGIIHMDLRFSAAHFARHMGFNFEKTTEHIISIALSEAEVSDMSISFIKTLTRDMPEKHNKELMRIACDSSLSSYFSGIDIAGDEVNVPLAQMKPFIKQAGEKGLKLTIHAGEAGPAENVREAIEEGASRIGHGVRSFGHTDILDLAAEKGIAFEVCPTSNLDTDTITDVSELNLGKLLEQGILITINTDDPGISNTSLSEELEKVQEAFSFSPKQMLKLQSNSLNAAFINEEKKGPLLKKLENGFKEYIHS